MIKSIEIVVCLLAFSAERTEQFVLPPRAAAAPTGSTFLKRIESLGPVEREAAIQQEILAGNVPEFLRTLKAVEVTANDAKGQRHTAKLFVLCDYLAIGTDADFFRMPMRPLTAQAIADAAGASLLTAKLSDDIYQQAELKLEPRPLTKDREFPATFYQSHQIIEEQRQGKPLGLLVAGIKKDVVLTNRLSEKARRVAIYGWHRLDGKPIQPLYVGHSDSHVDYSHGIRLMSRHIIVDGRTMDVDDVLKDPVLNILVSGEGPIVARYQ